LPDSQIKELEEAAILYDRIKDGILKYDPSKRERLDSDFSSHIQRSIAEHGDVCAKNVNQAVKDASGLRAKYSLYEISLAKLV